MRRTIGLFLSLLVLIVLLSACAQATPTPAPTSAKAQATPTSAPPAPTKVSEKAASPVPTAVPEEPTATAEAQPAAGKPLKIGQIVWQTGALSIYGEQEQRGFELGLEYATHGTMQVAGRPIQVITRDSEGKPDKGVQAARELIESQGVEVLEGGVSSAVGLALSDIAKENKLIYLADPAAAPQITGKNFNPNVFRVGRNSYQDALDLAGYLVQNVGKTFVQIAPDYAFGRGSAAAFRYAVEKAGGTFVADDVFAPLDTTDFTPYLQQVLDSGAKTVIVTWAGKGFIPLFQQMQDLGIPDQMAIATGFGDNKTLPSVYPEAVGSTGLILYHYTLPQNAVNNWLVQKHQEKYSGPPDLFSASGFATAQALVKALEMTGGDSSAEKLIPVLEGMTFDGPKGTMYIRPQDHQTLQPMYIVKLTNTDDPQARYFELVSVRTAAETAPPCLAPGRCPEVATEPVQSGKTLKVGQIVWQTGALSIYGEQEQRGFELGLEYATHGTMQVAGRPIQVITRDSEGKPDKAVQAARELIESQGVEVLEGGVSSAVGLALSDVAKENKLIYLADPAAAPQITGKNFNPNVFRVDRNSYQDALALAGYLVQDVGKTFVQIAPDYAFGRGSAAAFRYAVEKAGGTFVADDVFAPLGTTDFTPYLQQVLDSKAKVLIVTWAGKGFIPLFQQMQELGVPDQMAIGTGFGDNKSLPSVYPEAVGSTGLILYHYTLPHNEVNDWLVQKHQEKYGEPPDLFAATGFGTAQALVKALEMTGGDSSAEKLIPALEGMTFDGPKGTMYIRSQDHQTLQPMYIVKLTNTDDPQARYFELVSVRTAAETAPPCLAPGRCP